MGADPSAEDDSELTPLGLAAEWGSQRGVRALLAENDVRAAEEARGWQSLRHATYRGEDGTARLLLAAGAAETVNEMSVWNGWELTPLEIAAKYGQAAMVGLLVGAGADPNLPGLGGTTPLHRAAAAGQAQAVEALVRSGASPVATDEAGKTIYISLIKHALAAGHATIAEYLQQAESGQDG